MSTPRLTYTGIKYFTLQIIAYLIGIAFPIYVARLVPASDYGVFGFIAGLWSTFDIFRGMIPFWSGRMIARGGRLAKTALVTNVIISIPLFLIYLSASTYFSLLTKTYILIYFISSLYIPISYAQAGVTPYISMRRTEKLGYGPLILSFVKISIGLILVYYIGVIGAVSTLILGYFLIFLYFYSIARGEFEDIIDLDKAREWIKGSWFVLALSISSVLYVNLAVLLLGFLGKTASLGSYYVAVKVSSWLTLTSSLSVALGPRLLSEAGGERDVVRSIDLILLFATPMLIGIFTMNKAIIYLFGGGKYIEALIPLILLSLSRYIDVFSSVGVGTVFGFEKFDKRFRIRLRELVGSDMFKILMFRYLVLAILAVAIIVLYPLYGLVGLALSSLIAALSLFISVSSISFRRLRIMPRLKTRFIKYLVASIVMGIVVYLMPKYRSLLIVITVFIGIFIYFGILYMIDREFRILIKKGRDEVIRMISEQLF